LRTAAEKVGLVRLWMRTRREGLTDEKIAGCQPRPIEKQLGSSRIEAGGRTSRKSELSAASQVERRERGVRRKEDLVPTVSRTNSE